ncbi:hypothetical protein [Saccharothrix hoggarensis]|uniref:Neutral/alkaline ceramidase-like enzyme n=1 Tax=Saccharothrix hoggarensis TaxID=913853 RepID=A0ABW3QS65_9PSEU
MAFEAAVRTVDITPVHPPYPSLWMGGYGWGPRPNNGLIARRLRAHCLVLWDDGVPNVLLRADVVSIPRDVHHFIRDTVVREGLVDFESDFLLSSSHTHSGACLGDTRPDPKIIMNLTDADVHAVNQTTWLVMEALVQLVRDTVAMPRTPVTARYGRTTADLGFNRAGLPTVLDEVEVVVLRRAGTQRGNFAVLFGAACHPVARGNDQVFDSDYPGAAAEHIEQALGVPALFFQGAAGDQEPHHPHVPEQVTTLGSRLGRAVVDRIVAGNLAAVTGPVRTSYVEVQLPLSVDTTQQAVVDELRAKYQARAAGLPTSDVRRRHADQMLGLINANLLPTSMPMPIQCWRFGGLNVIALGHEVLSAFDVRLRAAFGGPLWVMGYANEVEGYVPDDQAWWAGGYEAGWSGDPAIAGEFAATMAYSWPTPLKASPVGVTPAAAGSAERIVLDTALGLLTSPIV